ncbi:toxin-antitoxin system TumE family protein [Rhizobium halophilum]|uniref:toxin-antitoxin system TumE family protein n=1 Tax=Rhizobium halophilum TaxID=2846852 RepID=UPI00293F33B6|nr:DUF6516 family protein [Rhizobium halophilum]
MDIKIWRVPKPVRGSLHDLKYSLALIANQACVLRYDNEAGKETQTYGRRRGRLRLRGFGTATG